MPTRVAINGFGRIGRSVLRAAHERAPTSRSSPSTTSPTPRRSRTCSRYDSVYGAFPGGVEVTADGIRVDGRDDPRARARPTRPGCRGPSSASTS